jgi:hypothetical protein
MPAPRKPARITIRAYQVGFGDCLLLTFHYASRKRHVLVDFGSTRRPEGAPRKLLNAVAKEIEKDCGNKLTAVIASHRHRDHVDGFRTNKKGTGPGDVIRALKPEVVLQPWTEDPLAPRDAKSAVSGVTPFAFRKSLSSMHAAANDVLRQLGQIRHRIPKAMAGQLGFLGEDNLSNKSAVVNLMNMAPNEYLGYGSKTRLEKLLPGVKVHILGPPTLKDTNTILRQRDEDEIEFWQLHQRFWQLRGSGSGSGRNGSRKPLFPSAARMTADAPNIAWFVSRLANVHASNLLSIVRILDDAMNNTSLIVLFEVGKKLLLFPGDAQYENWMYALDPSRPWRKKLKGVHVYKVGHHGSLNATPRTLWAGFSHATETKKKGRLKTVLSTLRNVHGHEEQDTEVPRGTLVDALKLRSDLVTTESLSGPALSHVLELKV